MFSVLAMAMLFVDVQIYSCRVLSLNACDALALNVTVSGAVPERVFTVIFATGGGVITAGTTVIVRVVAFVNPSLSVTRSVSVYVPAVLYVTVLKVELLIAVASLDVHT